MAPLLTRAARNCASAGSGTASPGSFPIRPSRRRSHGHAGQTIGSMHGAGVASVRSSARGRTATFGRTHGGTTRGCTATFAIKLGWRGSRRKRTTSANRQRSSSRSGQRCRLRLRAACAPIRWCGSKSRTQMATSPPILRLGWRHHLMGSAPNATPAYCCSSRRRCPFPVEGDGERRREWLAERERECTQYARFRGLYFAEDREVSLLHPLHWCCHAECHCTDSRMMFSSLYGGAPYDRPRYPTAAHPRFCHCDCFVYGGRRCDCYDEESEEESGDGQSGAGASGSGELAVMTPEVMRQEAAAEHGARLQEMWDRCRRDWARGRDKLRT